MGLLHGGLRNHSRLKTRSAEWEGTAAIVHHCSISVGKALLLMACRNKATRIVDQLGEVPESG